MDTECICMHFSVVLFPSSELTGKSMSAPSGSGKHFLKSSGIFMEFLFPSYFLHVCRYQDVSRGQCCKCWCHLSMFKCQQLADSCIASRNRHAFTHGQFPDIEFLCPEIHGFAPCFDKSNENGMTCWLSPSHIWKTEDQFESPFAGSALATNSVKRMKPKYLWKYFEIFWSHDITRHAIILQGHRLKFNANWATWHSGIQSCREDYNTWGEMRMFEPIPPSCDSFWSKVVASLLLHVSCSSGFDLRSNMHCRNVEITFHIDTVVAFQGTIWVCPKLQEVGKKLCETVEVVLSSFLGIIQHYSTSFNIIRIEFPEVPRQNIVNWLSSMAIGCWPSWL